MTESDGLLKHVRALAARLESLHRRAVRVYTPIVEDVVRLGDRDASHIERTLDGLLGFCSYEPALVLCKKLCRHWRH